jgi:hypothetical protein
MNVAVKDALHDFSFDAVLTPQHTQVDVYEAGQVERMLRALLKGSAQREREQRQNRQRRDETSTTQVHRHISQCDLFSLACG